MAGKAEATRVATTAEQFRTHSFRYELTPLDRSALYPKAGPWIMVGAAEDAAVWIISGGRGRGRRTCGSYDAERRKAGA